MINKIFMKIPGYSVKFRENGGTINGKAIVFSDNDLNEIIGTIRLWNNSYKGNNIISETHYYIKLYDNDDNLIDYFSFEGDYPSNFDNLLTIVGRLYEGK